MTAEPLKKLRSAAQQLRASIDGNGNLLKTLGLLCGVVLMLAEIELQRAAKE